MPGVKIEGDLFFRGKDVNSKDVDVTELRRQIGMVWQKPNPFPMSVYDNITYGPSSTAIIPRRSWTRSWKSPCGARRCGMN